MTRNKMYSVTGINRYRLCWRNVSVKQKTIRLPFSNVDVTGANSSISNICSSSSSSSISNGDNSLLI
jgi:hypothetical protein